MAQFVLYLLLVFDRHAFVKFDHMILPGTQSLETIYTTTRRLSFTQSDVRQMCVHFESGLRNGLDLRIQDDLLGGPEMLREGIVILRSEDLETDFALVNVDAGRGFFGGHRRNVLTYTSAIYRDQFTQGPVLGSLIHALVGINNLYRTAGILNGATL